MSDIRTITLNQGEPHEHNVRVNTRTTVSDVRRECPNFFSAKFGTNESIRAYKGFIIVRYTFQPSVGSGIRTTVLYAYDIDNQDTRHVSSDYADANEAKVAARELLVSKV